MRTRRAAFLLNLPSRVTAVTSSVLAIASFSFRSWGGACLPTPFVKSCWPYFLVKERAHARLHVNAFDSRRQQAGDRQHLDLVHRFRLFAQRDGIGHHQLLD